MSQYYEASGANEYDNNNEDDFYTQPFPLVSVELPPPHLAALKRMLERTAPGDDFEVEVRNTILHYDSEQEMAEIVELAEFTEILKQYAEVEVEAELKADN